VYSEEGTGRGHSLHRPLLAVPNVTVHPSTASVPITVFLYNGRLCCGFNVPVKGYRSSHHGKDHNAGYIECGLIKCMWITLSLSQLSNADAGY